MLSKRDIIIPTLIFNLKATKNAGKKKVYTWKKSRNTFLGNTACTYIHKGFTRSYDGNSWWI